MSAYTLRVGSRTLGVELNWPGGHSVVIEIEHLADGGLRVVDEMRWRPESREDDEARWRTASAAFITREKSRTAPDEVRQHCTWTIEIESADGEPIDMDGLRSTLRTMGIKARSSKPGSHLLARSALDRAVEQMQMAVDLADPDGADRREAEPWDIDKLDAAGPSGVTIDPTKGRIHETLIGKAEHLPLPTCPACLSPVGIGAVCAGPAPCRGHKCINQHVPCPRCSEPVEVPHGQI